MEYLPESVTANVSIYSPSDDTEQGVIGFAVANRGGESYDVVSTKAGNHQGLYQEWLRTLSPRRKAAMPGLIRDGVDAFGFVISDWTEAVYYYKDRRTRAQSEIAARVLYVVFNTFDIPRTPQGEYGLEISRKDLRGAKIIGV